jgi:amino acid transporter
MSVNQDQATSTALKRIFVGRPVPSYEEAQHRLPKRIALAVFSSDALSSSAYATDEIVLALVLAGSAALAMSVPIGIAVTVVLLIVIASYRQTVYAYPKGASAFIVAHDNLGAFPGLIAGSALLVDYVLTVSVSVAAGLAAVGAAFPAVQKQQVVLAVAVVAVIAALNLRGLKESGMLFSVPTYGFLLSMIIMISIGAFQFLTGNLRPNPPAHAPAEQALTLFLILRAFASGSTALTGVEAISDGVPAFRKPESKNAADTLLILGCLLAFLFLGLTFLGRAVHVDPHLIEAEGKTVPSQIAAAVFGPATAFFYIVQAFTALILFLAANTAFADFPRLASILAKDRYLPRVLQNRGDRLAFSNGILMLAFFASFILVIYQADVHKIIPLYVVGVFTSFTLSQAGMVRRWFRDVEGARRIGKPVPEGWRRKATVNGVGAVTTLIVLVIVSATKFTLGAWQVIIAIPALALGLYGIGRHFSHVAEELSADIDGPQVRAGPVVLALSGREGATKALAFARTIAPRGLRVVALTDSERWLANVQRTWDEKGISVPIDRIGKGLKPLKELVQSINPSPEEPLSIVLPDPQYRNRLVQLVKNVFQLRVKRAFLTAEDVVVISVPSRPELPEPARLQAPGRLSLIVFVSSVNKATVRAIQFAESLHPSSLKAMSIQTFSGEAETLTREWAGAPIDIPIEIVDSPFRSLMAPVLSEVRKLKPNPNDAVGVVIPEFIVKRWWHAMLHNQSAFLIKTALLFEPNVVVINVPYPLGKLEDPASPAEAGAGASS